MRHFSDDQQYSEQLLDKSTEIWTGAVKKRQKAMQSLTPNYSRQYQENNTNQSFSGIMDKQLESIKQKINTQKSASKQKDLQIQTLKAKISQLTKDKKLLMRQIGVIEQESPEKRQQINENSINLERTQQNQKTQHSRHTKGHKSQIEESIQEVSNQKLENLPKEKLLELLGSTSQYRAFIDYQDSYDLMFLKELHDSSKRITKAEKRSNEQWSQAQIQNQMMKLNQKQNLGLNYHNQNAILSKIRQFYDKQFDIKAKNLRNQYEIKLKKTVKESSIIPEDLKQICKIKQGQLAQQMTRKKGKSLKKNHH